jgi:hypothetical protein
MIDTDIPARIAALTQELDTLVTTSNAKIQAFTVESNRQVAFLEGKIAALQELLAPAAPAVPPPPAAPPATPSARTPRGRMHKQATPVPAEPTPDA